MVLPALLFGSFTSSPSAAETDGARTRLAVDEEKNIVHVIVEGREVGRFDKDGLHVEGDITYSGSISDIGPGPDSAGKKQESADEQ